MRITFSQLPVITSGKIVCQYQDTVIEKLLTDSRHLSVTDESLFFAVKGANHNGHTFLDDLQKAGIRQFVIEDERYVTSELQKGTNILLVSDSTLALQQLAANHRRSFSLPTVGITGSNGKTIVKEWLAQLLSASFTIVKSPKSYNSQIGVPLSVWQIQAGHTLGIFEAGISKPGEMAKLEAVIQPEMGIFTNIGPAHAEGFPTLKEKIAEKARLFVDCSKIVYCKEHLQLADYLEEHFRAEQLLSWGKNTDAHVQVVSEIAPGKTFVQLILHHHPPVKLELPFTDEASLENLLHCLVLMLHLGISERVMQEKVTQLVKVPMRLELKAGRKHNYLIDDTYNNDPEGLKIALQFLQQQNLKRKKILILSDMLESGLPGEVLYGQVANLIREKNISLFVGVGKEIGAYQSYFPSDSLFFSSTELLLGHLEALDMAEAMVLIKGARIFRFERIVQQLVQKIHRTVLEINLNALAYNLNVFRQMLSPQTKMMVMVKAFAYGSGSHEVAHLLQYQKVDYLGVAYTDEGVELRDNNISLPVMVMNPAIDEFDKLLRYKLEPEMYHFRILDALLDFLRNQAPGADPFPVHIAIDTGMHRLGFEEFEIDRLCELLGTANIRVMSVFSHLVGADGPEHDAFSAQQAALYHRIALKIEGKLGYSFNKHLLNSAGITRLPAYHYDMVRLGIGLYGIESEGHPADRKLQNVGTLKTVISQLRQVKKGDTIGYSRKGKAEKDMTVATLAIGYADGYPRILSNGAGKVWINGQLAPIIGNICMDMCMADVTGIAVSEGDEAELFGPHLPVSQVADWAQTISYELLTDVSERIKRVFFLD